MLLDATRGRLPLWVQVKERLTGEIEDGSYPPGAKLPTEHELIQRFGVSRTTVRAALEALVQQALVERTQGRGSFVKFAPVEQPVSRLASFHENMEAHGLVASARTLRVAVETGPPQVLLRLGLPADADVVVIERGLLASGTAIAFQRSYVPRWVFGRGELFSAQELGAGSLYALMGERSESTPQRAEEIVEATLATRELAELLDVAVGSPLLKAERLTFSRNDRRVEWVDIWFRGDRYRYRVELSRQ